MPLSRSSTSWHCSTPSSLPRSTIKRTRSAERTRLWMCGSMKSLVTGGVSISWTVTSSKGIIAGVGRLGGERVGGDLGRCPREAANQLALAGVGTAQEDRRAGPLPWDAKTAAALLAAFLGDQVLLELGDLGLQIGLEVVGPLVFGDLLEHDLETGQFFLEGRGPAVFCLGLQILLGEIGWHSGSVNKIATTLRLVYSIPAPPTIGEENLQSNAKGLGPCFRATISGEFQPFSPKNGPDPGLCSSPDRRGAQARRKRYNGSQRKRCRRLPLSTSPDPSPPSGRRAFGPKMSPKRLGVVVDYRTADREGSPLGWQTLQIVFPKTPSFGLVTFVRASQA